MRFFVLTAAVALLTAQGSFQENESVWNEIDLLNQALDADPENSELELLFRNAVDLAQSNELAAQFDVLRDEAYTSDDFTEIDEYVDRAAPAITVLILGESNNIGVNVGRFLTLADPGTPARSFFDLALDGFYVNGRIGTAELPVWMERAGSSAQAAADPELAEMYAGIWEGMSIDFQGYYLSVATETISFLGGETDFTGNELDSYYRVYEDPCVMHVRSALNSYLNGSDQGYYFGSQLITQLNKYRGYLADHFVVLSLDPSPMGGSSILMISQEKPDRIFDAWVYESSEAELELRGFSESREFNSSEIEEIAERYRNFLEDHEHSL